MACCRARGTATSSADWAKPGEPFALEVSADHSLMSADLRGRALDLTGGQWSILCAAVLGVTQYSWRASPESCHSRISSMQCQRQQ